MEVIRPETQALERVVIEGETPSLFDHTFLLREQLIGEIRGLKRVQSVIDSKLIELKNSENPDNENTTRTEPE